MEYIKTCPGCNAEFTTTQRTKIYCSSKCRTRTWQRNATNITVQERQCPVCKTAIDITQRSDKVFCSAACSNKWRSIELTKKAIENYNNKKCAFCSEPLPIGGNNKRKYCSLSCSGKARWPANREKENLRRKEYYAAHKDQHKKIMRAHYLKNKDHYDKIAREWQKNNPEKFKSYMKKSKENFKKLLPNHYVIDMIRKHDKTIDPTTIPQELIAMKREQLMIYRTVKQLIQTIKEIQND